MKLLTLSLLRTLFRIELEQPARFRRRRNSNCRVAIVERLERRVLLSSTLLTTANAAAASPSARAVTNPTIFVALFSGAGTSAGEVTGMTTLADSLEANIPNSVAVAFAPGRS